MITGGEVLRGVLAKNTKFSRPISYQTMFSFGPNSKGRVNTSILEFKEGAAFLMTSYIYGAYLRYFTPTTSNLKTIGRVPFTVNLKYGPNGKLTSQLPILSYNIGDRFNSNTDLPEYTLFENNEAMSIEMTNLIQIAADTTYFLTFFGVEYRGNING